MRLNSNYASLTDSYLFIEIAHRLAAYKEANLNADIIRLGIGDVTRPLAKPVVDALEKASAEMGVAETFRGYGSEQGYPFLREAIAGYYAKRGVELDLAEIFVSDGAKSDIADFLHLFSADNTVMLPDPVYPAYADANRMDGRKIRYIAGTRDNGFLPMPPKGGEIPDIIYICSPNNPTGAAYTTQQLQEWIAYAKEVGAVIFFDAAYECFVQTPGVPHSIFEVEGAREVAVEFCSLSKTAGFTGTRCGYTIVPKALMPEGTSLNKMWNRRQTTRFNEVPYVVQAAAAAVFTPEGMAACHESIEYYKQNAAVISDALTEVGVWHCGGVDSPYIWLAAPKGLSSWELFDLLLTKANVVGTPGAGFGKQSEGYFRLTGFGDAERTKEAARRIKELFASL
ncbi:MAG: LL-diaminopimelate aminotransferase [Oscillospiraceae bacterium]